MVYNHNCDTVARESIAKVDEEVEEYNATQEKWMPIANYKGMWRQLGENWGALHMGMDSFVEKILWYLF